MMSRIRGLFVLMVCVAVTQTAFAEEKTPSKVEKLLGEWVLVKGGDGAPPGLVAVFKKDGKLSIKIDLNGKDLTIEGTYKIAGDKITLTMKGPEGKEHTEVETIKTLTDVKFVTVDDKGKESEFKKKAKSDKPKDPK